jgi:hypothetical protein
MQDIGGCRAVVATANKVDKLLKLYKRAEAKNPHSRHGKMPIRNYIETPKEDGYRSVHLVYKYQSPSPARAIYNDHKIEIQLRSRLQHAWATAVEIVDAFTDQNLKSGLKLRSGDAKWRRFFALMGSAIAMRERRPLVPGTPTTKQELAEELRPLVKELAVLDLLAGGTVGIEVGMKKKSRAGYYMLMLDVEERKVSTDYYAKKQLEQAMINMSDSKRRTKATLDSWSSWFRSSQHEH